MYPESEREYSLLHFRKTKCAIFDDLVPGVEVDVLGQAEQLPVESL
jgi:hypothetical protein